MGGYAVLANVVRRSEASTAWSAEAGLYASTDGVIEPRAKFEYGRRRGATALDPSPKSERSEELRGGKYCVKSWRSWLSTDPLKKKDGSSLMGQVSNIYLRLSGFY